MGINFGVLRARPDRAQREDGASTPHLQILVVDDSGQPWHVAVNVQSGDGGEVVFWVVDPLVGHPILNDGNVGAHAGDNGAFHDGRLLLAFPTGRSGCSWRSRRSA